MPETIQLELDLENNLENLLLEKKHKFATTIAQFLCWALENNVDSFVFAEIAVPYPDEDAVELIKLGCKREEYLNALEKGIKNLIEFEEYELCPKLQEWIEYLQIEKKVKKND